MRTLLILLLSLSLFTACNNDKNKSGRKTDNTSKDDYRNGDESADKGKIDRNSGNNDDVVDDDEEGNHVPESSNWSSADVNSFTQSCVSKAVEGGLTAAKASSYCNCMLRKLSAQYPDINDAQRINMESPSMKAMVNDCLGIGKSSASTSSGWSRKDQLDFVNSCVREAKRGGMEDLDAQSYCDCMQYKIEKLYPDINDANKLTEADLNSPSMKKMIRDCKMEN